METDTSNSVVGTVGTWGLVHFQFRTVTGEVIYPFGEQARGSLIYTDSGPYSAQLMRVDQPRLASGDQMHSTVEESIANFQGCISYFNTYELDLQTKQITHHVEGSLFPTMEGRDQKRWFERNGN